MLRKSIFLFYVILSVSLTLITACSKQEENKTPPSSAATVPPAQSDDSASEIQKAPDEIMEKEQTSESSNATKQEDKPVAETTTESQQSSSSESMANNGHEEELALARKSGCLACHAIDKKIVGPPWRDVSKRYLNDPNAKEKLVAKVSKGGRGNWTDVVGSAAMPPYSPRVSNENITKLVEFVLSLEK